MSRLANALPFLSWAKTYDREAFVSDLIASVIVTIMLIPQSLAYALLAGLPAEMGLYASILPLIAYAFFGTSRTLSVGPVAVASLMTATAVGAVAQQGTADYATAAVMLAFLGGVMLVVLGLLRFGFVANFLSHPVVSGFITASGILIAISQLKHILGISAHGETLPTLLYTLAQEAPNANLHTLAIGAFVLLLLLFCRTKLSPILIRTGMNHQTAGLLTKTAPVLAILLTIFGALGLELEQAGVALVGDVPKGLPAFSTPFWDLELARELAIPALLIAIIGFVESVSVGKTLGAKRRQRIDPNQELIGLGAANLASAVSGGFPVTGGFSRSVVNFDAGAVTQAASIMTALGIAIAAMVLTPALYYLPKATLAATIVVAVTSLIDWSIVKEAWHYSRADFLAIAATIVLTLLLGVEIGVVAGVVASIGSHLYRTSRPHFAVVGRVPDTEHYRNVQRHDVVTHPSVLSIRIDESLYFANAAFLEDTIYGKLEAHPEVEHVVLMCPAVNSIDLSALEALEEVNRRLSERSVQLHLSEVKGPVMDALKRSHFLEQLHGRVFLNHHAAMQELTRV
ncbi:MAG: sulfate permease [Halieaceae bacterium]|nr:sulfate permease [Halieaceae bacterium]